MHLLSCIFHLRSASGFKCGKVVLKVEYFSYAIVREAKLLKSWCEKSGVFFESSVHLLDSTLHL